MREYVNGRLVEWEDTRDRLADFCANQNPAVQPCPLDRLHQRRERQGRRSSQVVRRQPQPPTAKARSRTKTGPEGRAMRKHWRTLRDCGEVVAVCVWVPIGAIIYIAAGVACTALRRW
jgi:hypothetical protein